MTCSLVLWLASDLVLMLASGWESRLELMWECYLARPLAILRVLSLVSDLECLSEY